MRAKVEPGLILNQLNSAIGSMITTMYAWISQAMIWRGCTTF